MNGRRTKNYTTLYYVFLRQFFLSYLATTSFIYTKRTYTFVFARFNWFKSSFCSFGLLQGLSLALSTELAVVSQIIGLTILIIVQHANEIVETFLLVLVKSFFSLNIWRGLNNGCLSFATVITSNKHGSCGKAQFNTNINWNLLLSFDYFIVNLKFVRNVNLRSHFVVNW